MTIIITSEKLMKKMRKEDLTSLYFSVLPWSNVFTKLRLQSDKGSSKKHSF